MRHGRIQSAPAPMPEFVEYKPVGHELTITLPFPPSVNNLFSQSWRSKKRFISKKYRIWRDQAYWLIQTANLKPIEGTFEISISLDQPDKRPRDADNYQKAVIDALVKMRVVEDDKLMRKISTAWGGKGKNVHVKIRGVVPA
jgi:Holliday junction resolvase RusA-like endonuclease